MSILAGKTRTVAVFTLMLALVGFLGLTLSGCSSSDSSPEKTKMATLVITHDLVAGRSLDSSVKNIQLSGYNASGNKSFSPETFGRSNVITKQVPAETTSIRLVYSDVNGEPVGIYVQAVKLTAGQEYPIDNPAWQDIDSQTYLTALTISPTEKSIAVGEVVQFAVSGKLSADGSSFAQDMTDDALWKLGSSNVILGDLGEGAFKGYLAGKETVTAYFGAIEATATVTVTGASVELAIECINVEPIDGVYYLPLAYDDLDNVLEEYATGLNLMCPMFTSVISNSDDEEWKDHVSVSIGDETVVSGETYLTELEGENERVINLSLHPKKEGQTSVTIAYAEPNDEGDSILHVGSFAVEVVNAELKGFKWDDSIITAETGNTKEIPLGTTHDAKIKALFSTGELDDPGAMVIKTNGVSTVAEDNWDFKSDDKYLSILPWGGYSLADGTHVYSTLQAICEKSCEKGITAKLTITSPTGYTFVLDNEYVGTDMDLTYTVGEPIIRGITLDGFGDEIAGYRAQQLEVDEAKTSAVLLVYTDDSAFTITDEVELSYQNPGVLEFTAPLQYKAVALGRAFITVHDPLGRDVDRDYLVDVVEEKQ